MNDARFAYSAVVDSLFETHPPERHSYSNGSRMSATTLPVSIFSSPTRAGEDDTVTWDEEMIYGCVCDSKWEVGLGAGQTQEPEWFGPDCSLRHCPSGDDPSTDVDETDCYNVTSSSVYPGAAVSVDPHTIHLIDGLSATGGEP